ncbi:MAG: SBBP repeat-containing protein, partial [Hyphomicrobiales bacterium]
MKRGNLMQWGALAAVLCGMAGIGIWSARVTGPAQTSKVGRAEVPASARSERVSVPIAFAPNHGQASDEVRFTSTGAGCSLTLTAREAILAYRTAGQRGVFVGTELTPVSGPLPPRTAVQRMGWIGANPDPVVRAEEPLPGKMNYYRDSKSRHAVTNIPTYARVRYENLWPGIDLEYHGESGSLEYDFVVAPGADPSAIRLTFPGADRLALDSEGNLEVAASGAVAPHARPQLYQDQGGRRVAVEGRFAIRGPNEVGFEVGSYDRSARLVIDPVITYSRYLGDMLDIGSVHVDANGIWVVGGCASSIDPNPSDPLNPGIVGSTASEGLSLIRLDPTGATVLFQTNILDTGGGQLYVDNETPFGLDVDASGNAYIAGNTNTYSNPYVTSGRAILDGPLDVLVGRFDATGAITGMVLLGGNGTDGTAGAGTVVGMGDLKLDSSGNVWITTGSNSTDLSTLYPSVPGYDQTNHAFMEEVLFRLDPSSLGVTYWSFLGGNGGDRGMGIRFGTDGSIYVAGNTNSTDFPVTAGAFQTGPQGGLDFTITKLDPTGTSLVYSTYLGGSGTEGYLFPSGPALAVDEDGCAYFRGITTSADFPVVNAAQPTLAGGADATLSKLDATGQNLVYSTYLGGSGDELSTALVVDDRGNAYVSGYTYSNDFPTVNTSVG